jgi:hypothetical protein
VLSALGQFVVYTLIKLFKQHIVPFIITTRKIVSVVISILFFKHKTNIIQLSGMALVFGAVVYEFLSEVKTGGKHGEHAGQEKEGLHKVNNSELKEEEAITPVDINHEVITN